MSELTPCPQCQRHVRNTDTTCPFCEQALTRSGFPARPLPRARLGRAATFAFGATLLSTTAFIGCGGESQSKKGGGAGTSSGGNASGGNASGGTASGGVASGGTLFGGGSGELTGGTGVVPPYGSPPVPDECDAAGGALNGVGCESDVAGAPAAGSGTPGGNPGVPPR